MEQHCKLKIWDENTGILSIVSNQKHESSSKETEEGSERAIAEVEIISG